MSLYDSIKALPSNIGGLIGEAARIPKNIGTSFMSSALQGAGLEQLYDSIFGSNQGNTGMSLLNNVTKAGLTGQQIAQNEWTAQREDTAIQRQVADMAAAGLNPAMLYGNSSPSGSPSSPSAQQSAGGLSMSDMLQAAALSAQIKVLESEAASNMASAAEKESNISLNRQLEQFNDSINPLRIEAAEVANSLGRSTQRKIEAECDRISAELGKIAAEIETEATKQLYNLAAAGLADAQARQIVEMLPYSIELTKAQTSQAKAIARLNFVQAAYQNRLLNDGFVDALIGQAQSSAAMQAVKERIKTGKAFTVDDSSWLGKAWNFFAEASGLSHGVQVIDYILDKINVFAPLVSKAPGVKMTPVPDIYGIVD